MAKKYWNKERIYVEFPYSHIYKTISIVVFWTFIPMFL